MMKEFLPDFAAFNFGDFQKLLDQNKIAHIDWEAVMDINRKNAQTLSGLQQMGLDAIQEIYNTSQKVAQDIASEQAKLASTAVAEGTPEEKIAQSTKAIEDTYERIHKSYRQLADMQYKLSQDMSDLIARRIKANMKDLQDKIGK